MGAGQATCQPECKKQCSAITGADCAEGQVVDQPGNEVIDMSAFENYNKKGEITRQTTPGGQEEDTAKNKGNRPRRQPFEVNLERTGKHWRTLGLLVSPDDDPRFLIVDDIWEPSLISEWNASKEEELKVKAGDIIKSVNGSNCNGEDMLAMIQALGKGATISLMVE
jgi:hypothetical protein